MGPQEAFGPRPSWLGAEYWTGAVASPRCARLTCRRSTPRIRSGADPRSAEGDHRGQRASPSDRESSLGGRVLPAARGSGTGSPSSRRGPESVGTRSGVTSHPTTWHWSGTTSPPITSSLTGRAPFLRSRGWSSVSGPSRTNPDAAPDVRVGPRGGLSAADRLPPRACVPGARAEDSICLSPGSSRDTAT